MRSFIELCDAVAATPKRGEKLEHLATFFRSVPLASARLAAVFLSGRAFPSFEETTLGAGAALLSRAVASAAHADDAAMSRAYREHGDFGAAAEAVLAALPRHEREATLSEVDVTFRRVARAKAAADKALLLTELFARSSPKAVKYTLKIITGDLRIGSKEALVEEAIARAFGAPHAAVARANLLLGDIGAALVLAAEARLDEASMRLFHPLGFMLATPAESVEEARAAFEDAIVEDKFDGIRAQAHVSAAEGRVRLFSRTRDDVTESFPELASALSALPGELVIDGEILAYRAPGGALPFAELQKRLGRKKVDEAMMRAVPVAFVAFDLLYRDGMLLIDASLSARGAALDDVFAARKASPARAGQMALFATEAPPPPMVLRAERASYASAADLDALFAAAQARGNEGLMIKDAGSAYSPGRRGRAWLKLKRELATLDVVITGVEFGHGKRARVLSDYTFSVRDDEGALVTIGKAYTGLTDVEIGDNTRWFMEHTTEDRGHFRLVEPTRVVEVAFNAIMKSDRHESGFALRFPRIARMRDDKAAEEADSLSRVREIFARQPKA